MSGEWRDVDDQRADLAVLQHRYEGVRSRLSLRDRVICRIEMATVAGLIFLIAKWDAITR